MVQRLGGVESQTIPRRVALSCGFGSNCLGMGGVFCSEAGGRARISWFSDSAESKARQFHGVSHEHAGSGRIVSAWVGCFAAKRMRGSEFRGSATQRSRKPDNSTACRMSMRVRVELSRHGRFPHLSRLTATALRNSPNWPGRFPLTTLSRREAPLRPRLSRRPSSASAC